MTSLEISRLLRKYNISPTAQRVKMALMLLEKPQHLSAEEIYFLVNKEFSKTAKATVYNNLNLFVEAGLLRELNITPTMKIYDSNTEKHYHFVDEKSGNIIDVDIVSIDAGLLMQEAEKAMQKKSGKSFKINDLQVVFKGQ